MSNKNFKFLISYNMEKQLIIKSEFDCVIYSGDLLLGIININKFNDELKLNIIDSIDLKIYPTEFASLLPYSISLDIINNDLVCKNKDINILKLSNEINYIKLNKLLLPKETNLKTILNCESAEIFVFENSKTSFFIKNKSYYNNIFIDAIYKNFHIVEFKKNFAILSECHHKKNITVIDSQTLEVRLNTNFSKVEYENDVLKILYFFNDFYRTGKVEEYNLNDEKVELTNSYFVYKNSNSVKPNEKILCYIFVECIKNKNIKVARLLLSDYFNSKITDEQLLAYFNDISTFEISPLSFKEIIVSTKNKEIRIYKFKTENLKITDIDF